MVNVNFQKQITFTPKQYQLESDSIENKLRKIFRGTLKTWDKFLKPAVNVAALFIGMAVAAKSKSPEVGRYYKYFKVYIRTTNIFPNISQLAQPESAKHGKKSPYIEGMIFFLSYTAKKNI